MVQYQLDSAFAAVADPIRRGILASLSGQKASISDLARSFGMSLTGIKKHVAVLEQARLVATTKVGRVRTCRLGPNRMEREAKWIAEYQRTMEASYRRLDALLERIKD